MTLFLLYFYCLIINSFEDVRRAQTSAKQLNTPYSETSQNNLASVYIGGEGVTAPSLPLMKVVERALQVNQYQ